MIDIRYVNTKDLQQLLKKINYVAKTSFYNIKANGFVEEIAFFPALPKNSSRKLYNIISKLSDDLGDNIKGVHVGYGTDCGSYL